MKNLSYVFYLLLLLVLFACVGQSSELTTIELIDELEELHKRVGGNHEKIVNLYKLELERLNLEKSILQKRVAYQDTVIEKQYLAINLCMELNKH